MTRFSLECLTVSIARRAQSIFALYFNLFLMKVCLPDDDFASLTGSGTGVYRASRAPRTTHFTTSARVIANAALPLGWLPVHFWQCSVIIAPALHSSDA